MPLRRSHPIALDGSAVTLAGGEVSITLRPGDVTAPCWVVIQPGDRQYFVPRLPWRWQGAATSVQAFSSEQGGGGGGGFLIGQDFTQMSDLSELDPAFNINTPANISLDVGVGLDARWLPSAGVCTEQSLVVQMNVSPGLPEIWVEERHRYSANWTTENPACPPNQDYKMVLFDITPNAPTGSRRFDWRVGHTSSYKIMLCGDGFPVNAGPTSTPPVPSTVTEVTTPIAGNDLWDGLDHTYRWHLALIEEGGIKKCILQSMVGGVVLHSYKARGNPDRAATAAFSKVRLGANRNVRVPEEMHTWIREAYLYDVDPGWFDGVTIDDYS